MAHGSRHAKRESHGARFVDWGNQGVGLASEEQNTIMEFQTGRKIVDEEFYWIFDHSVPLQALGKNVECATYYLDAHSKIKDVDPNGLSDGGHRRVVYW